MWTATMDVRDETAKGGFRREVLASKVTREVADHAAHAARGQHMTETGHAAGRDMTFPGATWLYCGCGATFHTQGR